MTNPRTRRMSIKIDDETFRLLTAMTSKAGFLNWTTVVIMAIREKAEREGVK